MPVLERVRNISFLSTILELYSEIAVISETVRNRTHVYIHSFFLKMTDAMASQNIGFLRGTLCIYISSLSYRQCRYGSRYRKLWVMGLAGPQTKNECAGEDQQQFTRQTMLLNKPQINNKYAYYRYRT
jgi:hypothetical protein